MEPVCVSIIVSGHVQGVGFRYSTQKTAKSYSIKGFVKNHPDGTVYILAEGKQTNLDLFVKWCHDGPSHAHVTNVSVHLEESMNLTSFSIKY